MSDYPVQSIHGQDNSAPEFDPTAVEREVSEGKEGMAVGAPVKATDDDRDVLNYVLTGTDATKFEIDQKTGQITTSVDLDYESGEGDGSDNCTIANECEVTVQATDSAGATAATEATVTISIEDVDEKPEFATDTEGTPAAVSPKTISRDEDMTALADDGSEVNVTYAAPDPEGRNVNLTLMGTDRAKFELSGTGILSFREKPDYEKPTDRNKDNKYEVMVRASDGALTADRMVTVTVMDVNEAPEIMITGGEVANTDPEFASATAARTVAEDATVGTNVGAPVTATDADEGDTLTYTHSGADRTSFRISSATGQLRTAVALDFETKTSYSVTVTATDSADASDSIDVTITVTDVDEEVPPMTLLERYDTSNSGEIEKPEMLQAIRDYQFGQGDASISKDDVLAVIRMFQFP